MIKNLRKYIFIGKTLFFPKEKILVIGDLHLGFEKMLRKAGLEFPIEQFEGIKEEIEKTIKHIKARYGKIDKIILLGDLKHHYSFELEERKELNQLVSFLRKYVENENRIIFIRGNHEKNDKNGKYVDYHIEKDIVFVHGDRDFLDLYDKRINLIVMGHLHPSVTLRDEMKIRNEKYKCFLVGRHKKKEVVILPSFLSLTEGIAANEMDEIMKNDFSIITREELEDFEVFVCRGVGEEALGFGKLGEMG